MIQRFLKYLKQEELLAPKNKVLLAISGGVDSMVLCHLLQKANIEFSLAHCNFQLRGEESNEDERFIRAHAKANNLELFVSHFDTHTYAEEQKIGIQEAARDLRYSWFRELSKEHGFTCIATAHHKDDQAETVLMNFIRGSGTKGLGGIYPKRLDLIRPLLFASKQELIAFTKQENIEFRNDSSNESKKYRRNLIRHDVLPYLQEINPSIKDNLAHQSVLFREASAFIEDKIKLEIQENCTQSKSGFQIPISWLKQSHYPHLLLWEILSPYRFSSAQTDEALELINVQSGRFITNQEYTISRNREDLLITPNTENDFKSCEINSIADFEKIPNLSAELIDLSKINFSSGESVAFIDMDSFDYPLTWRPWQAGDVMWPLGMKGKQKLSDILVQRKIPLNEKKACYVLETKGNIIWLAGVRFGENFKIKNTTKEAMKLVLVVGK